MQKKTFRHIFETHRWSLRSLASVLLEARGKKTIVWKVLQITDRKGKVMFSQVSVCLQSASWLLAHCSTLRHGRYASYWNAFCILFSLRRNSMTFCLIIPVFLLLPRSLVHKFNVFIIQIKLTNEARNSVTFTIILDGAWRESLKIVFRSWGSNGKRKSIQKLKDKHNVVQQDNQSEFLLSSLIFSLTLNF